MKIKKILMCLSIVFTLAVAGVVGFACNDCFGNKSQDIVVNQSAKYKKPTTITYAPNTIQVQRGGNNISYSYVPNLDLKEGESDSTNVIAYEYAIGNSMNNTTTGVNLKSIKTDGVNVSYYYSDKQLDTTESITGETSFTLQELENNGDIIYIYILVSPEDTSVPTDFTTNVVWYYGVPIEVSIVDNVSKAEIGRQAIISGQKLDDTTFKDVPVPTSQYTTDSDGNEVEIPYYFDNWFYDEDFSKPVTEGSAINNSNIYIRYANLPSDYLQIYNREYQLIRGTSLLPADLVIPSRYNNKNVTTMDGYSISNAPFAYKTSLVSVDIPNTMTNIGYYGFYRCTSLTTVNFGKNSQINSMSSSAFQYCSSLKSITIPSKVQYIPRDAFSDCTALESVVFESNNTLSSIQAYAFLRCSSLKSINIPRSVTSIGQSAFSNCTALDNITIPNGIKTISNTVFYYCSKLTNIVLPDTLTTISSSAFSSCSELVNINIPNSVTKIDSSVFRSCSKLQRIKMPSSLQSLGSQAFYYCTSLTDITIPDGVTTLNAETFYNCTSLTSVSFGDNGQLASIGEDVFYKCTSLTSIDLGNNSQLTSVGEDAFYGCNKLNEVNITDIDAWCNIDFTNYFSTPLYYSKSLYLNKEPVIGVTIPTSMTEVKPYVFYNCKSLTNVILHNNITTIGSSAFSGCSALTSVNLSNCNKLTSIGSSAFSGCKSLIGVNIPSSVTSIGSFAFNFCEALTSINIPASVTSMGTSAFQSCSGLERVDITDIDAWCNIDFGDYNANPLQYAENLYLNNELVTSVTIPSSMTEVKPYIFYNCSSLTSVTLHNNITNIGNYAFNYCTGLTSIDLSNCTQLTSIGNSAFEYCSSLTSVDLSDCTQLTTIGRYAFGDCSSLESVNFSNSLLAKIESMAFADCYNLSAVYITDIDAWCNIDFSNYGSNPVRFAENLYLDGALVTSVTMPTSITEVKPYVFYFCKSLTSVILHDNITTIGYSAFSSSGLTSIDIPDSVTSIGSGAFSSCSGLTSIVIPDGVTSIEYDTFMYCDSLTTVEISENSQLVSIGTNAFFRCGELKNITIPASVTSIGDYAFYQCYNLTSLTFRFNEDEDPTSSWYWTNKKTDWEKKENGAVFDMSSPTNTASRFVYYWYYWYKKVG